MATKTYTNIDKPVQLVEMVTDNGDGTGNTTSGNPAQVVGNVAAGVTDTGNPVKVGGKVGDSATGLTAATNGQRQDIMVNYNGAVAIAAHDYGGNAGADNQNKLYGVSGRTGTGAVPVPVYVHNGMFNGTAFDRGVKPNATSRIASAAASVNATSAKGSAGNAFRIFGNNVKASVVYLKLYNKATAPTVGTDTPVITVPLAASSRFDIDLGEANGFYFSTGIAYGLTTDALDAGTTALAAGDILGFTLTYA